MEAEGMVHALEQISSLLKPDGYLIDIHPVRETPLIKVFQGSVLLFVEADPGYDYDADLRYADESLAEIIRRGVFHVEGEAEFEVITCASSAAEMQGYWAEYGAFDEEAKDEAVTACQNEVYARAEEIMRNTPGAEITYHERARITRLALPAP